jgi:phage FluMu protein Com
MSVSANASVAVVFSPQVEVAEQFVATVCGPGARSGKVNVNGIADVMLEVPLGLPADAVAERIKSADFTILLLRFVDEETLDVARALVRSLPPSSQSAVHFVIARMPGEVEFKMSCPKCGQKLLVKDSLAFRRTQCPRCKHPFTIPGQADLVRREFLVPPIHKVSKATLGDAESCGVALANAYRQSSGRRSEEKSSTMRLDELITDLSGEDTERGSS